MSRAGGTRPVRRLTLPLDATVATALAFAIAVALTAPAAAQPAAASRVVLLHAAGDDQLSRQGTTLLKAELQAVGFEVVEVEVEVEPNVSADAEVDADDPNERRANPGGPRGRDLRRHIERASARLQPVATFAIRSIPGGTTVELWLEDRLTGKLVIRRVNVAAGTEGAADLAVKAVELLRGSLLEVTVHNRTGAAAAAPTPPDVRRFVAAAATDRREYFTDGLGVSAGATALRDFGIASVAYAPLLRFFWGSDGYALRLSASGLGSTPNLQAVEGSATLHRTLLLVEGVRIFRGGARLQPFAGAAAGLYRVSSTGRAVSSLFPEGQGTTHALVLGAQTGIAARLGNRLALVLDFALLASAPRTSIKIATREVANTGGLGALLGASFSGVF